MTGFAVKFAVLVLAFVAMASALPRSTELQLCRGVTCPTSYMPGNYLAAKPRDRCSYCQCVWGSPVLKHCSSGLGWSEMYSQCIPTPGC